MQRQTNEQKSLNLYFREIRMLMPVHTAYERKFLADLKQNIKEFVKDAGHFNYLEVIQRFGEPKEVIDDYYSSISTAQLNQELRISRLVTITISFILIACMITLIFCNIMLNKTIKEHANAYNDRIIVETMLEE